MSKYLLCKCNKAIYDNEMLLELKKCIVCNEIIRVGGKEIVLDDDRKKWRYDLTKRKFVYFQKIEKKKKIAEEREHKIFERNLRKAQREENRKLAILANNIVITETKNGEFEYNNSHPLDKNSKKLDYIIVAERKDKQIPYLLKSINEDDTVTCYSDNLGLFIWPKKRVRKFIKGFDKLNSHIREAKMLIEKFGFFTKVVLYTKKKKK